MNTDGNRSMARTLHGDVFFDDVLYEAETATGLPVRIVYLALHTVADREGRFRWNLKTMRFLCLDGESAVESCMLQLQKLERIIRYRVDGIEYGQILDFAKHQHINPRERASVIPPFTAGELVFHDGSSRLGRRSVGKPSKHQFKPDSEIPARPSHPPAPVVMGERLKQDDLNGFGQEDKPEDESSVLVPNASLHPVMMNGYTYRQEKRVGLLRFGPAGAPDSDVPVLVRSIDDVSPVITTFSLTGPIQLLGISHDRVHDYDETYPHGDNEARVRKASRWMQDNPSRRKTAAGINRFLNAWINNAQNSGEDIVVLPGYKHQQLNSAGVFTRVRPDARAAEVGAGLKSMVSAGLNANAHQEVEVN